MNRTFKEIVFNSLPLLSEHTDDLMVHDKREMNNKLNVPFIHFTRNYGTSMIFLSTQDYPKKGIEIPHLFGTANRNHLLSELKSVTDCHHGNCMVIQHYDGKEVKVICHDKALSIVHAFTLDTLKKWRNEQ